jgi:uncharacterized protein YfbU (UPF0304 family)
MEKDIIFLVDLYWVKMRALARGELDHVKELENHFPKLADKDYCQTLEKVRRMREALQNSFSREELKRMIEADMLIGWPYIGFCH